MADQDDDGLTQRERRAQRHRQNRSKDRPAEMKKAVRSYGPMALIVLVVLGAAVGVFMLSKATSKDCPDPHWHATAAIYLPGKVKVDFASPRSESGLVYYDWDTRLKGEGDPHFGTALHMHQSAASPETGSAALGPAQWHMEKAGACVSVKDALRILEIDAGEDSLHLRGGHEQVAGQSGTFEANASSPLRWFVQDIHSNWAERTWDEVDGYQLQDGESILIAMGSYTDAEIKDMQAQIPAPISRAQILAGITTTPSTHPDVPSSTSTAPAQSSTTTTTAATA